MPKLATTKKPTTAAPKLAAKAKPGKAAPKLAAAKGEKVPTFAEGATVEFLGYANAPDEPMFNPGERLIIVAKGKDADQKTYYNVIAEADKADYDKDADSVNGDQVYGAEIKKAEKAIVDPYAIAIIETEQLTNLLTENGGDPLAAAQAAQQAVVESTLFLGGAIGQLWSGKKFLEYGDYEDFDPNGGTDAKSGTGWDKFCQEQLGMGGRKAFGLITIYNNFAGLGDKIDLEAIAADRKIGWVKLEYMASVVNADNVQELIEAAQEQNVHDFRSTIKTDYKNTSEGGETRNAGASRVKRTMVKLQFFEDQAEGVTYVLEAAKKQLGMDDLENVVEAILMQWGAEHLGDGVVTKARQKVTSKQTALKKAGVNIDALKERSANLENYLAPADSAE